MKDKARYLIVELAIQLLNIKYFSPLFDFIEIILFQTLKHNKLFYLNVYTKYIRYMSVSVHSHYGKYEDKFIFFLKKNISSQNIILKNYLKSPESKNILFNFGKYGQEYQVKIKFPKKNDFKERQGDLVVMKPYVSKNEKGALLIQYNDSFKRFASIYNLKKIADYYRIILEPSTWGYQGIEFLLYLNLDTEILIQSQRLEDYQYIKKIGNNLIPVRIGAGDWIDPDTFVNDEHDKKFYDFVMVASWLSLKRHDLLFESLSKIKNDINKIALVGYPINGRTLKDIKKEAKKYKIHHNIDFYEQIPNEQVASLLKKSKFSVMLSKREGASRVIYESFFSNVPVVISQCNIGVNHDHINEFTGIFSSDEELHNSLLFMKKNYFNFSPRKWALNNTGCYNSTKILNDQLKQISVKKGLEWTKDIYKRKGWGGEMKFNKEDYQESEIEFDKLGNFLIK